MIHRNVLVSIALAAAACSAQAGTIKFNDGDYIKYHNEPGGPLGYHEVIDKEKAGFNKVVVETQQKRITDFLATNADSVTAGSDLAQLLASLRGLGYEGSDREILSAFSDSSNQ